MRYRPAELAEELGVSVDTIYRSWIPAGAPFVRDSSRSFWVVGTEFAKWALDEYGKNKLFKRRELMENEAWCMRCNQVVTMLNSNVVAINRHIAMKKGFCKVCGCQVNKTVATNARAVKNDQSE